MEPKPRTQPAGAVERSQAGEGRRKPAVEAWEENAGTSNERGEKRLRRMPKGSWSKANLLRVSRPKPRPKGVGDGQQVDIPVPRSHRYHRWRDG